MNHQSSPNPARDTTDACDGRDWFLLDDRLEEIEPMICDTAAMYSEAEPAPRASPGYLHWGEQG